LSEKLEIRVDEEQHFVVVMVAVMWFAPRLVKKWLPTPSPAVAAQPAAVVAEVERA